ncbi:Fe(3+) ions import ATP-binding protein FbpC [Kaistia sp. 32K]|uniref:ABC transporter ATP-binding protein n=1 Tax=Kaistia sp. 32K TaxID=2795690 RepID=UPI001914F7AF|nr:ABC transporter ATP-binding protein [Kaistia sp. 32K]BCP55562.1 Fe(3+) ions import ATP-binding protein FbpC [Kaistia sp. 32K]
MTLLELRSVAKRYGSTEALAGIDLDLAPGSRTAIVGPSGSGKTTLLRVIAGFETPDQGRVVLDGEVLADGPRSVPPHRRGIGIVAQDGALFPHLSIADNIGYGIPRQQAGRDARIRELMAMTGLDAGFLRRRPDQLSGGQQQRVALARALARRPRLMLLDEPFSALDTRLRAQTRQAVSELLGAEAITTILVTHDQAEALSFADQVAVMRQGRLPQAGTPRELYLRPVDPMVAQFLGEAILLPARIEGGIARCALGRIAVDDRRSGPGELMLRPDQISFSPVQSPAESDADDVLAEVIAVDFAGASSGITARLVRCADDEAPSTGKDICFAATSMALPAVGTLIRLSISGKAHVFTAGTRLR